MHYQKVVFLLLIATLISCGKKELPAPVQNVTQALTMKWEWVQKRTAIEKGHGILRFSAIPEETPKVILFPSCCENYETATVEQTSPGIYKVTLPKLTMKTTWTLIISIKDKKIDQIENFLST